MAPVYRSSDRLAPPRDATGRLSGRGKGIALALIALGLLTFFVPIIKFDPPAYGQMYWSVWDIALRLQTMLHPENPLELLLFLPFGLIYVTLVVAIAIVLLVPFRSVLRWTSLAGLFLLYPFRGIFGGIRLAALFESAGRRGDFMKLWGTLGVVMLGLAAVAWTDTNA